MVFFWWFFFCCRFVFAVQKKIGTVFFSQRRRLVQTGRGQKAPDSEAYEQNTLRGDDREIKAGGTVAAITHPGNRGGGLMAKCKIQVTIHTGSIICDAFCWRSMSRGADVGLLFGSHNGRA